ncbi:uncharacterized protein LOC123222499 [Mangifera indica]|uniref:uncharacterized protein LOC123222499 n=1 Tax=Mangifera indica TaxID=29780 RepID=UPI001CFB87A9|nr:uncharacterized protein LOC123222499 [Mangifera indica]
MADGKLNLPDDFLSSKTLDQHRSVKDEAWGGTGEEKSLIGLLDESKDQVTSENSIPLSPQWLYAKPIDPKTLTAGGEMRAPNSLPQGNTTDTNLKDSWRLDGSQEKKDWRKAVPDIENSCRWREEERETGILGRRDRRKEDRRADATFSRDISETRALSSADRWHDPSNRTSGHESRRDTKWSSRWGPEDKEKDSRFEKRTEAEKEDTQIERQSFVSGNRTTSERDNDSRDKWRPRHRMEVHAGGPAAYRSAPGFGLERGRVESSNVRFAPGRGRSTINGSLQIGRPLSVSVIGSVTVDKLSGPSAVYCYPRAKLLDIYRKQKTLPNFDSLPDEMDNVSPITQFASIEPLAFVAPDAEEEATLGDIWKGRIRSSEVLQNSNRVKNVASCVNTAGFGDTTISEGKQNSSVNTEEIVESLETSGVNNCGQGSGAETLSPSDPYVAKERGAFNEGEGIRSGAIDVMHDGLIPSVLKGHDTCGAGETTSSSNTVNEVKFVENQQADALNFKEHLKLEDVKSADSFEVSNQLPDDSNSLFDFASLEQTANNDQLHQKGNSRVHPSDVGVSLEDLSLFYLDPQGVIQGPYMGIDIIMWFEQGYFGTDLPVRLSDAPAGSAFQELGEIMPHLKVKTGSSTCNNLVTTSQLSGTVVGCLEESVASPVAGPDYNRSAVVNNQLWVSTGPDATSVIDFQLVAPNPEHQSEPRLPDNQNFQNSVAQDEEIVFPGRPGSSNANHMKRSGADIHSSFSSPASHHSLVNEFSETSLPRHQEDDKLHPFGLLMSELRDSSHLRRSQSSNLASRIGDHGQFLDSFDRDAKIVSQSSFSSMADQPSLGEMCSDDYRRNTISKSHSHQGSIDAHLLFHGGQELKGFDMAEHLMSQNLLKEQHQQQNYSSPHPLSCTNELGIDQIPGFSLSQSKNLHLQQSAHPVSDMKQLLEIKLQQQRHLELQRHVERQHQRYLELQHQRHLELQHQRQLELQHQRQLELQQERQLKLLQQQRQLELERQRQLELEQQRQLELEQQRQLELQQQHRLRQQQQFRFNQMKMLQQQQQQQQLLLEQLFPHQMPDPGYGQLKVETVRDNLLNQAQLRMQLLNELQQDSHARHPDQSLEQIIQAKIGQSALRGQPVDFLDLRSQAKHANMPSSEEQLHFQQEQLRARQLSIALRQQSGLEGEGHITGPWSVDVAGQFARSSSGHHPIHSAGFSASDFYQQQQRLSSDEEQFNHHNWNHAVQERHQRGLFEPSSMALDRLLSVPPALTPGRNLDNINTQAQGLDFPDQHLYMHSTGQLSSFSSGIPSHSQQISDELYATHPDMKESHFSGSNMLQENSWIEKQMQQLNLKGDRQRKDADVNMTSVDSSLWTSTGGDGENSEGVLMDLLHQNSGLQSVHSADVNYQHNISSTKTQDTFWPISETQSSNLPFNLLTDQEVTGNSSFVEGPQNSNSSAPFKHSGNGERLILRSNSGVLLEQPFLSGSIEHSSSIGKSTLDKDFLELEGPKGKRHGSKGMSMLVSEMKNNLVEQAENSLDYVELPRNAHSRHSSLSSVGGNGGFYNYEIGLDKSHGEISNERLPPNLPKGLDNDLSKQQLLARASSPQDVLPESTSAAFVKQKSSITLTSDEGKRESVSNPVATQVPETQAPGKKDVRFRRTSSFSDAAVSETSFIDMLKKPVLPEADPLNAAAFESSDVGAPTGRSGKKKGKKGRQIDPALLGFKVSSNRIMMGEIQRLED